MEAIDWTKIILALITLATVIATAVQGKWTATKVDENTALTEKTNRQLNGVLDDRIREVVNEGVKEVNKKIEEHAQRIDEHTKHDEANMIEIRNALAALKP